MTQIKDKKGALLLFLENGYVVREKSLRDANFSKKSLRGIDFYDCDLRGAVFTEARLTNVSFEGCDLRGVNFTNAKIRGAPTFDRCQTDRTTTLHKADLRPFRQDVRKVLSAAKKEVPALLRELRDGRIDGKTYEAACACLKGTIAHIRKPELLKPLLYDGTIEWLEFVDGPLTPDSSSPSETWFLPIRPGDTPKTSLMARIAEMWILEYMKEQGIKPLPKPKAK